MVWGFGVVILMRFEVWGWFWGLLVFFLGFLGLEVFVGFGVC